MAWRIFKCKLFYRRAISSTRCFACHSLNLCSFASFEIRVCELVSIVFKSMDFPQLNAESVCEVVVESEASAVLIEYEGIW